ncbi:MAG: preprotein translocase subunit SecE [Actinomycetota bacterium]|nr:preprotein translocase subunit SecE [Actinomycetota bacterium]
MNRQMKRMLQRQGQVGADGLPESAPRRAPQPRRAPAPTKERTSPAEFLRDVRGELRKVAWPTRAEVVNYSTIVLVTLILLITLIFVLDLAFAKSILFLFKT